MEEEKTGVSRHKKQLIVILIPIVQLDTFQRAAMSAKHLPKDNKSENNCKWSDPIFGKKKRKKSSRNASNVGSNSNKKSDSNKDSAKPITVIFEKNVSKNPMTYFTTRYHISSQQRSLNQLDKPLRHRRYSLL